MEPKDLLEENQRLRKENQLLKETIAQLEKRIEKLEEQNEKLQRMLRKYQNPHTPSSQRRKGKTKRNRNKEKGKGERFPGKPTGSNGGGVSLPEPDREEHHMMTEEGLLEVNTWEKTIIELVRVPFEVVKHVIHVYKDQEGQEVEPQVDLPQGIYGKRLQALVTLLRGTCGTSHQKIAELVKQVRPDLSFSPTTSLNLTDDLARRLEGERERILDRVKQGKYVHMDETGLRKDGDNGWVWTFAGPQDVAYEVDRSRSQEVPQKIMGSYSGTAIVDGYSGYNSFRKQRCWDHLGREVEETEVKGAVAKFHQLRKKAEGAKKEPPVKRERFIRKAREVQFPSLIKTLSREEEEKIATKLENALPDLFRGVTNPDIPLTNNHAERLMRKVVVHRKLWGCIRNEKGARFIENVLSCMETWKLQDKNLFKELQRFIC